MLLFGVAVVWCGWCDCSLRCLLSLLVVVCCSWWFFLCWNVGGIIVVVFFLGGVSVWLLGVVAA